MFHEFGHTLHGLFSDVRFPYFAGTSVPRDFVEYPSQVNEMWATWPDVLKNYAVHHETGEPMPTELLDKVLATETFNQRNSNASVSESLTAAERIVSRAHEDNIRATVTIAVSFGCPFEGKVNAGHVLELAGRLAEAGSDEIVFADTIGVAVPRQVRDVVIGARSMNLPVGVHLHNTRNTGFANALAAIEGGVSVVDASVGGIGGCPFAPRATGNICTEDLVYMLHGEGIETGIDLDLLITVAEWLEGVLERELEGQVYRAGIFAPIAG